MPKRQERKKTCVQSWNGFWTIDKPTLIHRHDKWPFLTRVGLKSDPSLVYCMIKIQIEIEGLLVVKRERGGGRERVTFEHNVTKTKEGVACFVVKLGLA